MKLGIKVLLWGALIGVLGFTAFIVSFGGPRHVSLETTINSTTTLIPQNVQSLNLTEKLTDKLTTEIIEKNPTGPTTSGVAQTINSPEPAAFAARALQEQLQSFDAQTLIPLISESDIIIVSPTTARNATEYFQRYFTILENNLLKVSIDAEHPEFTDFVTISKQYKRAMAELAATKTPDKIIDIQLQSLEILGAQANIFEIYSKQTEDPLKALFAAQLQEQLVIEAGELQEKVLSYIIE